MKRSNYSTIAKLIELSMIALAILFLLGAFKAAGVDLSSIVVPIPNINLPF